MASASASPTPNVSESTLLAVDRTRLAHERTLMAWVRTATSMISFGFTIAKLVPERASEGGLLETRTFSSIMIGVALIALLFASVQHHHEMKALRAKYPDNVPASNSMIVASLVSGFGLIAFVAVMIGR
jgi:putative membrane protein